MKALKNLFLLIIIIALLSVGMSLALITMKTVDTKVKYIDIIDKYSKQYNSDPLMIAAIIKVESDFDTNAVSPMNAKGLMQIVPDTGKWISERLEEEYHDDKLHDPDYNIHLGAYYYEYLYEHFGDVEIALAAYNGGMGNVEEWLKDPNISYHGDKLDNIPFGETKNYVEKVMNTYKTYKLFYENELPNQAEFDNPISLIWNNYKAFVKDIIKSF
ncbi:lytic transglycosylase domain-containing protein [Microaceticoccus formicicus]|uniref:lytic transglycosylase domain-containing protein n=1 Tax=Microaceticoccus formicicus TaxID=3118105 RepID=UPI003CD01E19|nr:lytic transglycosylase domain-containing protein [Peptoniphilaceae bacterium AMB_02]